MLTEVSMSQRARPGAGRDGLLEKVYANSHIESYTTTATEIAEAQLCSLLYREKPEEMQLNQ
jgi:hypothetical protein